MMKLTESPSAMTTGLVAMTWIEAPGAIAGARASEEAKRRARMWDTPRGYTGARLGRRSVPGLWQWNTNGAAYRGNPSQRGHRTGATSWAPEFVWYDL